MFVWVGCWATVISSSFLFGMTLDLNLTFFVCFDIFDPIFELPVFRSKSQWVDLCATCTCGAIGGQNFVSPLTMRIYTCRLVWADWRCWSLLYMWKTLWSCKEWAIPHINSMPHSEVISDQSMTSMKNGQVIRGVGSKTTFLFINQERKVSLRVRMVYCINSRGILTLNPNLTSVTFSNDIFKYSSFFAILDPISRSQRYLPIKKSMGWSLYDLHDQNYQTSKFTLFHMG